jgi:hypothetical protein
MKLPRLRVWQQVYREALSFLKRPSPRRRRKSKARKPHSRTNRIGRPLYRSPGIESLEPRIDVATFWFDSAASTLHVTFGDDNDFQGSSVGLDW